MTDPSSLLAWASDAIANKRLDADGRIKPIATQVMELADLARRELASLDAREQDIAAERAKLDCELAEIVAERTAWDAVVAKMAKAPAAPASVGGKAAKPRKPRGLTSALNPEPPGAATGPETVLPAHPPSPDLADLGALKDRSTLKLNAASVERAAEAAHG